MAKATHWADQYIQKRRTAEKAVWKIQPGQRVFIGSACGEPQHLVRAVAEASDRFVDIEIVRLLALESAPLTRIASKSMDQVFNIRQAYLGSAKPKTLVRNLRYITPINLSAIPKLFESRRIHIHVALIQVSPPDDFGWMSLGVSVDITLSAALSADWVIAQVNPRMPRVLGNSFIHVNDVDAVVEHEEDVLTVTEPPEMESANEIGRLIAGLVEDGSTLHISPGATSRGTLLALSGKKDLGVHTEYITDGVMKLISRGVITNRKKGQKEGRTVASSAIGSHNLYRFLDDNPSIEFQPSDYVNDPAVIAGHNRMVSMDVAMAMDLTGQVAADALLYNHFTGVTGMLDFVRGAMAAPGGKSIMMLPSTRRNGTRSRIVPLLGDTAVVVPRGDVHYVVTEYGAVNLFGKNLQERAMALIGLAHPDFRDELFQSARSMGLLSPKRTLVESIHGIYPRKLEETIEITGEKVTLRPARPVDARRIQEHFYNLDKEDVVSRFFHEKTTFLQDEIEEVSHVDYVKALTVIALVGEFGFWEVIAVGQYLLESAENMAEVAFSVARPWQGRGLGKILIRKLADAARENGISGLMAFTTVGNQAMIQLFEALPYRVHTTVENEVVELRCRFDEPEGSVAR